MSDNFINISSLNPSEVEKVLSTIKKLAKLGKGLAALTPTQLDDTIMDVLDRVVTTIEPFAKEQVTIDILNFVIELFKKGDTDGLKKAADALSKLV